MPATPRSTAGLVLRGGEGVESMLLVVLGVLVAGGAGAFAGLAIADNPAGDPKYTPEMLGQSLPTLNGAAGASTAA
jgi:hypothetical protein